MNKILLDVNGIKQFNGMLADAKERLLQTLSYDDAQQDEETARAKISKLSQTVPMIQGIERSNANIVDIGDVVTADVMYPNGEVRIDKFLLTGNYINYNLSGYNEVTVNSPIGSAMYKKRLGEQFSNRQGDKVITGSILEFTKYKDEQETTVEEPIIEKPSVSQNKSLKSKLLMLFSRIGIIGASREK